MSWCSVALLVGCGSVPAHVEKPESSEPAGAAAFLDAYFDDLQRLETAHHELEWQASLTGSEADFAALAEADIALKKLHSNPARYAELKALIAANDSLDPLIARALEVAELSFRGNQIPDALIEAMSTRAATIHQTLNNFRGQLDGQEHTNNELLDMLAAETDSDRRQAIWESLKLVGGAVAPNLIELAKVRNEAARALGFENYWDMQIRLQEHDPAQILAIFDELEQQTNAPFAAMKTKLDAELAAKFGVAPQALMPWHYDNPFFQAPPPSAVDLDAFFRGRPKEDIAAIATRYYADLGLPVDEVLARSDLYEKPGKDQHAFCTDIDRNGDVRTLLNVQPNAEWMGVMLHELGHAVYFLDSVAELPFNLRGPAHIFTTEAVAMLFGAYALDPRWLSAYAGVDAAQVAAVAPDIAEQRRREQLIFARWTLVMLHAEKALYEDPERDMNTLWWDLVERFQGLHRPAGRDAPDWASKPHFVFAPVYYHNYMLGELFASQLRATWPLAGHDDTPAGGGPELGAFLREKVFVPGASLSWPEFVQFSTGEPLTARYFAEEVE